MANNITDTTLRAKWSGKDRWLSDGGSRGAGRLLALVGKTGSTFYYQYFNAQEKRRFLPVGPYDSGGKRGLTLQQARDKVAELSSLYRRGVQNLHEHFDAIRAADDLARKSAEERALREREESKRGTLREMLNTYTAHLERAGKQSADDAANIFRKHVFEAFPTIADRRASDIPVDDFVSIIGKLVEANKGRTAAKLRSFLRAAYALAIKSKTDPTAPLTLRVFGIRENPLASIGALSVFNRTRDRTLSADELGAFIRRLQRMERDAKTDAVLLSLLLGGQRPTQLLRVQPIDVDLAAGTILLLDPKGSRQQPRRHVLPLPKKALAILERRLDKRVKDEPLFSTDGKTSLRAETLSGFVSDIAASMLKEKDGVQEAREDFDLRDLRRTCETMLAGLGVPSDIRAQLQSHGLGGVQVRHYDRHEYALEKRAALEKWERHLDRLASAEKAKVLTPRFRKKKSATIVAA